MESVFLLIHFQILKQIKGGKFLKYIIPKNYDITPKILGTFEFYSLLITLFAVIITFVIISLFNITLINKISICIIINLPIFLLLNFGIESENILFIITYLVIFLFSRKTYIYDK